MLPASNIDRWIRELRDPPNPENRLFRLACSIDGYCGVISPWGTPCLIFGDLPVDIFYLPDQHDGLFFRWDGADSIEQLTGFAMEVANGDVWDETVPFEVIDPEMTLMDTCTFEGDPAPRIQLTLRTGAYTIRSRYAENTNVMTVVQRLDYAG